MAIYTGAVFIDIRTYDTFRNQVNGNGYDLDLYAGCQCVDLGCEMWYNVGGYSYPYLLTGPNGYAYEIWTVSRNQNAGTQFELITDKTEIKRGDMVILGPTAANPPGHNAFADEDYNGTDSLSCLGQNQGGTPAPSGGAVASINTLGLDAFLGAFRYKKWHEPIPPVRIRRSNFPWVLYARKLREKK